jgi:uncharacterized membrane protein (UPF0127 family)
MRRPPPRALPLVLVLVLFTAGLSVSCGGCERHVDEPLPEVQPRTALPAPEATGKPWGTRCVHESPAVPRRKTPPSPDPRCPKDPEKAAPLRPGKVTFMTGETPKPPAQPGTDPQGTTISVEIAENDHDRQRGLMYRTSMPADHGMIFWFEEKTNHSFWMHNTCIPLDMLYLDADGLIVGIEENTPTLSDDTFEVGCESTYVLEVNAGWTRAHGVMAGQRAKIEGI